MSLPFGGNPETILFVESQPALRKFVTQILEDANFTVISASNPRQAVQLEMEFPGTIDLLLSDLTLAGTSGPNLAERLKVRRPQMRVVLISGYPRGALLVLNGGWHYLEKPFVRTLLASKLRDVFGGETLGHSAAQFDTHKVPRRPFGRVSRNSQAAASQRTRRRA